MLHQPESDTEAHILRACPDGDTPAEAHALAAAVALTAGSQQLWSRTAHAGSITPDWRRFGLETHPPAGEACLGRGAGLRKSFPQVGGRD